MILQSSSDNYKDVSKTSQELLPATLTATCPKTYVGLAVDIFKKPSIDSFRNAIENFPSCFPVFFTADIINRSSHEPELLGA